MRKLFIILSFLPGFVFAQHPAVIFFDSLLQKQAAKGFSGVVLVAEKGNPVYQKAIGYREFANKLPLKETDIFEMASVSKQFTAMIIMMLKEKGLFSYDELVEKYLVIPYKGITIRHLLTHTSGLPDYQDIMDKYWDKTKVAGNADCIAYLNKYAPTKLFEPGAKYTYSNTGYLLLASIAEKVSGKDFIELCRKWIFRPLKMKSTNIRTVEEKKATSNFAIGHIYVKERNQYIRADSFPSSDYTIWLGNRKGPGRISSTVADLLKWDNALYTEKLIKQSTLQEAFTPMKLNDGSLSNYGFGWMLRTDSILGRVVYHTGDNPGYKTQIIRYIDKNKTIILLNNNAHTNFATIIKDVAAFLKERQQ
ncbi:MAG: serine hydrolase domain-containing protein [Bacteroidota bacterium]|nr:serine hydrolase domain-containing protein [Bacteroidota bacterium]